VVRDRAAARPGLAGATVRAAFLGHSLPSLSGVLSALATDGAGTGLPDVVLVPLLLTDAYHSKTDIPSQVAAVTAWHPGLRVHQASALGPHPLLLSALERRLAEAGANLEARAETSVVLAAAGASDPAAGAAIAALAARWQAAGGWRRVIPAFASAAGPSPADAVRALLRAPGGGPVVVASYLLAPGFFADKIRVQALEAGAAIASGPLGSAPEVADVIIDRYLAAAGTATGVPVLARNQTDSGDPLVWGLIGSGRTPLQDGRSWANEQENRTTHGAGTQTRIPWRGRGCGKGRIACRPGCRGHKDRHEAREEVAPRARQRQIAVRRMPAQQARRSAETA
jgi:sirohydrochlorin ferrochelatase